MAITIREYQAMDQQSIITLFNNFQDYLVSLDPLHRLRRLPEYGQRYLEKTLEEVVKHQGKFFVAENDGKVIGLIVGVIKSHEGDMLLSHYPSTHGEVIELYVEPEFRAQQVGTQLMEHIETYFQQQHCQMIFIEVFEPNHPARYFYEKHGYKTRDLFLAKELAE